MVIHQTHQNAFICAILTQSATNCNSYEGGKSVKQVIPGITYDELAARYGVNRSTVYRWMKRGLIEPTRFCGRLFFTKDAIEAFEEKARR